MKVSGQTILRQALWDLVLFGVTSACAFWMMGFAANQPTIFRSLLAGGLCTAWIRVAAAIVGWLLPDPGEEFPLVCVVKGKPAANWRAICISFFGGLFLFVPPFAILVVVTGTKPTEFAGIVLMLVLSPMLRHTDQVKLWRRRQAGERPPEERLAELAAERERILAEARAKLNWPNGA